MSKFIKLMNADPSHLDRPLIINVDHITTIFEESNGGGLRTMIYSIYGDGAGNNLWHVEESLEQVYKMLKD